MMTEKTRKGLPGAYRSWCERMTQKDYQGQERELWLLESNGDVNLLYHKQKIYTNHPALMANDRKQGTYIPEHGNEDPNGRAPLYSVWSDNKHVYCGPVMQEAYKVYWREIRERDLDRTEKEEILD